MRDPLAHMILYTSLNFSLNFCILQTYIPQLIIHCMYVGVCLYLKLLVLGVVIISPLLELSDLAVQPGYHRLPVIPQLPVPLLLHMQALSQ